MAQEELKRGAHFAKESAPQTPSSEASSSRDDTDDMGSSDYSTVGRSAGLMTILTIVSRVTGFIRTWAMAAAIGMSLLFVLLSGRQQPAQYALRTRDGRHARDGVFARVHGREA